MSSARTCLLGAGGHASDIVGVLERLGEPLETRVLADDAPDALSRFANRIELPPLSIDVALADASMRFLCAVGYPSTRTRLVARADAASVAWRVPVVDPDASVSASVTLGVATVVFGQVWLSPMVVVGDHVHVSYGATVGHDTVLGRCSSIMPGASLAGEVTVGDSVLIGTNATILQGLHVGDGAQVGAGAVVTRDVPAGSTVVGIPARPVAP